MPNWTRSPPRLRAATPGDDWRQRMLADGRGRLASRQAELVAALAGRRPPPAEFDCDRVHVAARALAIKRRRSVARAWPSLATALHERFVACFHDYAAMVPLPSLGGPVPGGPG